ncbi:ABC transporter ATP-binding protein [Camelliibacillus cellulosilyticus]|uniref:ABC transporter ATP-binding protein n=1 Tax=Camelliibacillus cellulosilyticus TaxID=2174486 RepID=A0ABV9GQI0_9BACL
MIALEVTSLHKNFGHVQALNDVSVSLEAGKMLTVLGPSGCGKTTLLRSLAGFEIPDGGEIKVGGEPVYGRGVHQPPEKRQIGYVPQEGALFPHLSVAQNVGFGLTRKKRNEQKIKEMLALVGMEGLEDRMPHELSGGQQQRVALARALAPSPSIVLLDEPFSALDAGLRASLREDVRRSLKEAGATAVLVTHDQEEALSMADVIAVMRDGKIIQTGDPKTIYQNPADLQVATFVGEAVLLTADIKNGCADCPFGQLPIHSCCSVTSNQATIMIRPEQLVLGEEAGVSAQVVKTVYYGHDALVYLRVGDQTFSTEISSRVLGTTNVNVGDWVNLRIEGDVMAYSS